MKQILYRILPYFWSLFFLWFTVLGIIFEHANEIIIFKDISTLFIMSYKLLILCFHFDFPLSRILLKTTPNFLKNLLFQASVTMENCRFFSFLLGHLASFPSGPHNVRVL